MIRILFLAAALALPAFASSTTFYMGYGATNTGQFDFLTYRAVRSFDSNLGTLESVVIDWSAQLYGQQHWVRNIGGPDLGDFPYLGSFTDRVSATVAPYGSNPEGGTATEDVTVTGMFQDVQACHECAVGFFAAFTGHEEFYGDELLQFVTDYIHLEITASMFNVSGYGSGPVLLVGSYPSDQGGFLHADANWFAKVTYNTAETPEPRFAVLALFGLLIVWRAIAMKRRAES